MEDDDIDMVSDVNYTDIEVNLYDFSLQAIFRACSLVPDPFGKAVVFRHIWVADNIG